jgi:hypothetical protein
MKLSLLSQRGAEVDFEEIKIWRNLVRQFIVDKKSWQERPSYAVPDECYAAWST